MQPLQYKKYITPGFCSVRKCHNRCAGKLCSTHRSTKSRLADPVRYAFNNLRNRAKQRNKLFTITLDQFREWCYKYEYIDYKGIKSESYTVDRIYEDLGYHADNIQPKQKGDNIRKYFDNKRRVAA